ncbi:MAG TPA: hypothetical protein VMG08_02075 [Allosphingosinicella sp.]|nr:hypothetical protein [Allosphingosinicella sp.]
MPTRYQQLRGAVFRLSLGADEQHAYLESILAHLSGNGSSVCYGNDELALELEDIFLAAGDMREWREIGDAEIAAIKPLDDLLEKWSGETDADFWRRDALWTDPRWDEVRALASTAFAMLPDEERDTGWQATL